MFVRGGESGAETTGAGMKPAIGTVMIRVIGISPTWGAGPEPYTETVVVEKHTPKGVWLRRPYHKKLKFQLDDGGRYACLDLEAAMRAFQHRRVRYIAILESSLQHAQNELELAKEWKP